MINSHWGVLDLYLRWSTLTEVYLTCTLNDQLSLRCTWLVDHLRYKSSTPQWKLIILGTNLVHLRASWSFKIHIKYTSEWVDHLRYKSSTSLYLKWSTLTEMYSICILNDQLALRCIWLVPKMINSHWGVLDLHLKWSTLTEVYLICTLKLII
jgi:hypothetical protein